MTALEPRHSALQRLLLYARQEARHESESLLPYLLEMAVLEVGRLTGRPTKSNGSDALADGANGRKFVHAMKRDDEPDLLDMSKKPLLSLWDELLELQVEVFFANELDMLHAFTPWQQARTVLDAGCGNGCYLGKLHKFFPDKTYLGIDVSPELIARATDRWQGPNIGFLATDFFDFRPQHAFDLILMRFIVQHLKDFRAVLDQAARILRPGGGLLIIEPDLAHSSNLPKTPFFDSLFQALERRGSRNGQLKAKLSDLPELMAETPDWAFEDITLSVPHVGPFGDSKVLTLYLRWIELCERSGVLDYPYQKARQEISAWAKRDDAYSHITLKALYLKGIEAAPAP